MPRMAIIRLNLDKFAVIFARQVNLDQNFTLSGRNTIDRTARTKKANAKGMYMLQTKLSAVLSDN